MQNQKIEYSFLRAPFEELNAKFRTNKRTLEKEVSFAASHLKTMNNHNSHLEPNQVKATIKGLSNRLKKLRQSLEETYQDEDDCLNIIETRANYLNETKDYPKSLAYRLITEHYARKNNLEIAQEIGDKTGCRDLVDLNLFRKSKEIIHYLENKDVALALEWCDIHKSKLKKLGSCLEFQLKLQKFLELVKKEDLTAAINYAKCQFYLFPEHQNLIRKAMMLLAVHKNPFSNYSELLSENRWSELISLFQSEMLKVYNLPTESPLSVFLRSGLTALKTPLCHRTDCLNDKCPTCQSKFQKLVEHIPYPHFTQGSLICRILRVVMDQNNPPMALPNGQVFSQQGIKKITKGGKVQCPVTGNKFSEKKVIKLYMV